MYTCNLESMENKIKTFSKFGDACRPFNRFGKQKKNAVVYR